MDVAVLALALDARARAKIQAELNEIANRGDTSAKGGLVIMLREALAVLRQGQAAWTHASVRNASPMPPADAEALFRVSAQKARSRFQHELVRNFAGQKTHAATPTLPESDDPGRVVVTLVVAARRELRDAKARDLASLLAALDDVAALTPEELVAMEVIWSPAAEKDRMSLDAMRSLYPELFSLAPGD